MIWLLSLQIIFISMLRRQRSDWSELWSLTRHCSEPPPRWAVGRFGRIGSRLLQPPGRFRRRSLSLVVRHQDFSYDDAANKTLAGVGDTRVFSSARGSIRWAGQVTPQIRIHHGQWRAAPLPGLGWQGRDYAVSARDWRYGAYF